MNPSTKPLAPKSEILRVSNPSERPLALVTGASSGIGVEFARQLAARGFDLVITARRGERLREVQAEIQAEHQVCVEVIENDLAAPDGAQRLYDELAARGWELTVLVNNAGLGRYQQALRQPLEDMLLIIQVNLVASTVLTRLIGADMKARGKGFILNNASYSAIQPPPGYAVYAATKAYLLTFSQVLHWELHKSGVAVCVVCPGFFNSEFFEESKQPISRIVRWITLDRRVVARAAVRGLFRKKAVIIPSLFYKFAAFSARFLPRIVNTVVADFFLRH